MIFGQTMRFRRRTSAHTADDTLGATVAHAELLTGVLAHAAIEEACLFDVQSAGLPHDARMAVAELQHRFPRTPIRLRTARDLLSPSLPAGLVMCSSGLTTTPLAQMREASGATYPICSIAHSLDVSALVCSSWTLPLSRPGDCIVVSSSAGRGSLEDLLASAAHLSGGPGYQGMVRRIPLAVDTTYLQPLDRALCRHCLQLDPDDTVVLYLGRLTSRQKADLAPLLLALRELTPVFPKLKLLLAGTDADAGYSERLELMAAELGIVRHVQVVRNFPHFSKPLLYGASDIFVSPSDNIQETFGMALTEAMACGLPVVASDWSGYRDIVVHGQTGFLVPTYWNSHAAGLVASLAPVCDAARHALSEHTVVDFRALTGSLATLIANPELRATFARAGRARAEADFSWRNVIRQHEALWREMMQSRRGAPTLAVPASPAPVTLDDLTRRFGHYATSLLTSGLEVRVNGGAGVWELPQTASVTGITIASGNAILDACRETPLSIGTLSEMFGDCAFNTAAWLLKRGCLELSGADTAFTAEQALATESVA
ncbi:MAG: glycosyltransferase [Bryobacterales bacterium]|nr:glycosyltransferase [Bryobacterales bacterium]